MNANLVLAALVSLLTFACGGADGVATRQSTASPTAMAAIAAGATPPPALRGELTVFAASSLTDAFNEIRAAFSREHPGVRVTQNFAASSTLRTQLEQGARADIFASADQAQMDGARKAGTIDGPDQIFAKNKLIVIVSTANPGRVETLADLARPGVKLVLTDTVVPIGAYARTVLERLAAAPAYGADFDERVLANLRSEEANVRAVVTKVQLGEADAGIVYASDVTPAVSKDVRSIPIPDEFNTVAAYPIAVVRDAPNPAAARAFILFVRSAPSQEILKRHNFIVDRETGAVKQRDGTRFSVPLNAARSANRDAAVGSVLVRAGARHGG